MEEDDWVTGWKEEEDDWMTGWKEEEDDWVTRWKETCWWGGSRPTFLPSMQGPVYINLGGV
jgi:hypothetical protein